MRNRSKGGGPRDASRRPDEAVRAEAQASADEEKEIDHDIQDFQGTPLFARLRGRRLHQHLRQHADPHGPGEAAGHLRGQRVEHPHDQGLGPDQCRCAGGGEYLHPIRGRVLPDAVQAEHGPLRHDQRNGRLHRVLGTEADLR